MSDNAILAAMRRMGIGKDEMSGHDAARSEPQAPLFGAKGAVAE